MFVVTQYFTAAAVAVALAVVVVKVSAAT